MKKLAEKAAVLIEALPYIRNFYGKTFVIKYGGAAQTEEALKESFAQDIVLLNFIGIHTVVVHGGGPKISKTMEQMGKKPLFIQGQRITDRETMDIVEMVLAGIINKEIVNLINSHGGKAVGLSGKDGGLIKARKKLIKKISPETQTEEIIDPGLVGDVEEVDPSILHTLKEKNFIPVIAPVGYDSKGNTLNINADYVAAAIAGALRAEKLILMTDVEGILDEDGHLISSIKASKAEKLIDKVIKGGMIPKVQACISALRQGCSKTYIVDGRIEHALLLEIFTREGLGTEIVL
ncbi:MAG: acetylglutamate kinase [Thermodesulfovibrionales bacterium]|nr:acetylglutamate kinase [Thermodesulfovibrionales bacterium]